MKNAPFAVLITDDWRRRLVFSGFFCVICWKDRVFIVLLGGFITNGLLILFA